MAEQMGYAQMSGAANPAFTQGVSGSTLGAQVRPAEPPKTLASAQNSIGELNKRLHQLVANAHGLASALGGPFPCGGGDAKTDAVEAKPAMARLNDDIRDAHSLVSDIENCISSMARSLGA